MDLGKCPEKKNGKFPGGKLEYLIFETFRKVKWVIPGRIFLADY